MESPTGSIIQPRRLSVNAKLGGIFLLLTIIATSNLYLSNTIHDCLSNVASIVNQSGRLRYLSQEVALQSAGFALEPGEAARQRISSLAEEFSGHYARTLDRVWALHPLMRSTGDNLEWHLGHIDEAWRHQRAALERVLAGQEVAARWAAQREVAANAATMLSEADHLVNAIEKASSTAHRRVGVILLLVQALEALLMLVAFFYIRSRITAYILNLTVFARRFTAVEK